LIAAMFFVFPARKTFLFFLFTVAVSMVQAQVKLPACFSDNMVLQRDKPIPVWGKAAPDEKVTVSLAGKTKTATTDTAGKWMVMLDKMPASAQSKELIISSGGTSVTYKNVLIGDVWLCGGQSNMEYPMDRSIYKYTAPKTGADSAALELANPAKPDAIRYLFVQKNQKMQPELPTKGWAINSDTIVRYISAAGYFFAKEINQKTGIPIGILHDNWGGSRIEPWTPDWAYKQDNFFALQTNSDTFKIDGTHPGQMYNALISPLVPYAIKGILWYQGESNCMIDDQATYPEKFKLWLDTWRTEFKDKNIPCYYVQISPHLYTQRKTTRPVKGPESLPLTWEAQARSLELPNTGMIVTTDLVDDLSDIHPSYKWTVGHRLALIAEAKTYGLKVPEWSGPVYKKMKVEGNHIILSFDHAGSGLTSNDAGPLTWFSVAGEDGNFVNAMAEIKGNTVIVSAGTIDKPKHVRFAWDETAQPNFFNKEGLPAQPFRTKL
jgi:sialate O-acetylesterase